MLKDILCTEEACTLDSEMHLCCLCCENMYDCEFLCGFLIGSDYLNINECVALEVLFNE